MHIVPRLIQYLLRTEENSWTEKRDSIKDIMKLLIKVSIFPVSDLQSSISTTRL